MYETEQNQEFSMSNFVILLKVYFLLLSLDSTNNTRRTLYNKCVNGYFTTWKFYNLAVQVCCGPCCCLTNRRHLVFQSAGTTAPNLSTTPASSTVPTAAQPASPASATFQLSPTIT
jgi:hypothetical protein